MRAMIFKGVVAGVAVTATLVVGSPADANVAPKSPAVVHALSSPYASIWHQPGHGYLLQDAAQMHTTVLPPRLHAAALPRYRHLNREWRELNRSLWRIAAAHPSWATPEGGVQVGGRWFVAQQPGRFA